MQNKKYSQTWLANVSCFYQMFGSVFLLISEIFSSNYLDSRHRYSLISTPRFHTQECPDPCNNKKNCFPITFILHKTTPIISSLYRNKTKEIRRYNIWLVLFDSCYKPDTSFKTYYSTTIVATKYNETKRDEILGANVLHGRYTLE